jgi:hypothetical protein
MQICSLTQGEIDNARANFPGCKDIDPENFDKRLYAAAEEFRVALLSNQAQVASLKAALKESHKSPPAPAPVASPAPPVQPAPRTIAGKPESDDMVAEARAETAKYQEREVQRMEWARNSTFGKGGAQ